MAKDPDERPIVVPALEKALDILEYMAISDRRHTASTLSRDLDIPQASAFRILNTLAHRGYIQKNADGEVHLGPRNALLHKTYFTNNDLRNIAQGAMRRLLEATEKTVELAALDGDEIAFIDVLDSTKPITIKFTRRVGVPLIGSTNPITLVVLAYLDEQRREKVLDRMAVARASLLALNPDLAKFPFSTDVCEEELTRIREQGFSADYGCQTPHVTRIAAPVLTHDGQILGTIGVAGPIIYLPENESDQFVHTVVRVACDLSNRLGHCGDCADDT